MSKSERGDDLLIIPYLELIREKKTNYLPIQLFIPCHDNNLMIQVRMKITKYFIDDVKSLLEKVRIKF